MSIGGVNLYTFDDGEFTVDFLDTDEYDDCGTLVSKYVLTLSTVVGTLAGSRTNLGVLTIGGSGDVDDGINSVCIDHGS